MSPGYHVAATGKAVLLGPGVPFPPRPVLYWVALKRALFVKWACVCLPQLEPTPTASL